MEFKKLLSQIYNLSPKKIISKLKIKFQFAQKTKTKMVKRENPSPTKYIHIGYPKAASTSLQKDYFGEHPEMLHLGCGNKSKSDHWDDHGYISKEINIAMEVDIRYRNRMSYDAVKTRKVFQIFFDQAVKDEYCHAVGISNENICFNWHGGVDTQEKAERLKDIFGDEAKIVMICRNQKELIESLYKETVRFGYDGQFFDYLKYIWTYQFNNFFFDFHFDRVFQVYRELFGVQNVEVFLFEDLIHNDKNFLSALSKFLGVNNQINSLNGQRNTQLSNKELAIKLQLNKKAPHSFGNSFLESFDTHRYVPYFFENSKKEILSDEHYVDYYLRKSLNETAKSLSSLTQTGELELSWENEFGDQILESMKTSNKTLYKLTKIQSLYQYNYIE